MPGSPLRGVTILGLLSLICVGLYAHASCTDGADRAERLEIEQGPGRGKPAVADEYSSKRRQMVDRQIKVRGVQDPAVLDAMASVPRHEFVPEALRSSAYDDHPLPIGEGQTISQPYIVALMTEALRPAPTDRILELGTGSGYQAAVLAAIVDSVFTIEYFESLAAQATQTLRRLGIANVVVRAGDGWAGWPEHAPFDGVIVTFAAPTLPDALVEQLAPGGRICIPLGEEHEVQELMLYVKREDGSLSGSSLGAVRFVPVRGEGYRDPAH